MLKQIKCLSHVLQHTSSRNRSCTHFVPKAVPAEGGYIKTCRPEGKKGGQPYARPRVQPRLWVAARWLRGGSGWPLLVQFCNMIAQAKPQGPEASQMGFCLLVGSKHKKEPQRGPKKAPKRQIKGAKETKTPTN